MIHHRLMNCLALFALLGVATVAHAGTQAKIEGRVTDVAGQPIAGAKLTITTAELTTYERTVETDDDGEFQTLILDATRTYEMLVEADGFQPQKRQFKVGAGSTDSFFGFALLTMAQASGAEDLKQREQPGFKELYEGRELLSSGNTEAALAKFKEAVAAKPDLLEAIARIAELTYEAGDFPGALDAAKKCLDQEPEAKQCLAIAINSAGELGDEQTRAEYLARYQQANPDDPTLLFNEAAEFLNNLDDEKARPLLERCLAANPEFPECNFEYGMLLLRSGDMEGAKKHLQKYLEIAPDGPLAPTAEETIKYL
jgi:tetratricopeptide (TPR) repeat protein